MGTSFQFVFKQPKLYAEQQQRMERRNMENSDGTGLKRSRTFSLVNLQKNKNIPALMHQKSFYDFGVKSRKYSRSLFVTYKADTHKVEKWMNAFARTMQTNCFNNMEIKNKLKRTSENYAPRIILKLR